MGAGNMDEPPQRISLESDEAIVSLCPAVGGRIVRFECKSTGYDFLWRNPGVPLRREKPGAEYDPNFFGGIDELIPNDIPEQIDGIDYPDHGELWTAEMHAKRISKREVWLSCSLPLSGLRIQKQYLLTGSECRVQARIQNWSDRTRHFLWKLHAALAIEPGDRIECPAQEFEAADPQWSRRTGTGTWEGETVPKPDGATEFLYLSRLSHGAMSWSRGAKRFELSFDTKVFPFAWYFASYGGFDGHVFAILEPASAKPISVNDAMSAGQCSVLAPGQTLATRYAYRGADAG